MMFGTPYWLRLLGGRGLTWEMPPDGHSIYLTFDDGPCPSTTPIILDILKQFGVKATFFCVGTNVEKHPEMYNKILKEGHMTANHGHRHLKGWKTDPAAYVGNVEQCSRVVDSRLFRPPYGKMTPAQRRALKDKYHIIMWSVLSRDYDRRVSPQRCLEQSLKRSHPGSIIVFHDNEKSMANVEYVLPKYVDAMKGRGFEFRVLDFGH